MAHQALYRRYRPSRFSEVVGQPHVTAALQNAVAGDRVAHAYLFSGPRGTGKTSTARILARALNCLDLQAGEPCGECQSCQDFAAGTSYDMHELDAASHNSVEDVRELNSRVAIGSPGRAKVYVLDEVHMLSSSAENALLKTLEEPPPHVVFILCTTEPHKVAQTIRSRTQHLLFGLLPSEDLSEHVQKVAVDAGIDLADEDLEYVMSTGGGSARDALSALEQVRAAGKAPQTTAGVDDVLKALAGSDVAAVLVAVEGAVAAGQEPRVLAEGLLRRLRSAFLASVCGQDFLSTTEAEGVAPFVEKMSPRQLTHAMELLSEALVGMRTAPDPRVDLTLALVRLSRSDLDTHPSTLAARVERLEAAVAELGAALGAAGGAASGAERAAAGGSVAGGAASGAGETAAPAVTSAAAGTATGGTSSPPSSATPSSSRASQRRVEGRHPSEGRPEHRPSPPPPPTKRGQSAGLSEARKTLADAAKRPLHKKPLREMVVEMESSAASALAASALAASAPDVASSQRATHAASTVRELDLTTEADRGVEAQRSAATETNTEQRGNYEAKRTPRLEGAPPEEDTAEAAPPPSREKAVLIWPSDILPKFSKKAVATLAAGRFLPNGPDCLRLAFEHHGVLQRATEYKQQVEEEFSKYFRRRISVKFESDKASSALGDMEISDLPSASMPALPKKYDVIAVADLETASPPPRANVDGLTQMLEAFPDATVIDQSA